MRPLLFLVCLSLGVSLGCRRKPPAPPPPTEPTVAVESPTAAPAPDQPQVRASAPSPAVQQPPKSLPPPPPYVTARAENNLRQNVVGEVNAELSRELRLFMQKKGRLPESFSEFANVRLDSIPRPPEGKKWVIDLDTLQVKAVSAKQ